MEVFLDQLRMLASPSLTTDKVEFQDKLESTLKGIASTFPAIEAVTSDFSKDIYQKYVQTCVFFLLELRSFLASHPEDPAATQQRLSIQSQANIKTVLEIVVCWGLNPCLQEGVGIPISKRSKTAAALAPPQNVSNSNNNKEKNRQLLEYVRTFLLLQKVEEFTPVILSRNLPDIFSALIQLIHEPVDECGDQLTIQDRFFCESSLKSLITSVNPSLVVEGLSMGLGRGPAWYTQAVGTYLSYALMCPNALRVVLERVLGSEQARGSPAAFSRVVRLVSACPSIVTDKEYYSKICPQILPLLHRHSKTPDYIQQVSVSIIGKMSELKPDLTHRYFFDTLFAPLTIINDTSKVTVEPNMSESLESGIVVDESTLAGCVEDIHTITSGLSLSQAVMAELSRVVPVLFRMHLFTSRTKSYLKTAVQEILVAFFRFSNKAVGILKDLILPKNGDYISEGTVLSFSPGSSGGVVVRLTETPQRDFQEEATALVTLLKEMKNDKLAGNLFVDLLSEFLASKPDSSNYIFLDEDPLTADFPSQQRYLVLLEVVAIIGEQMGASVLKNVLQVCTLLKILLTHEDPETLSLSLGLVVALLSGGIKVSVEEETLIYDLVPQLDQLTNHPDAQIVEMAAHIKTLILANDPIWKESQMSEGSSSAPKLNEEIKKIMEDIRDPLLPVRAHGLISLRKLVLRKDPDVKKYALKMLDIFWSQISDEDSYVFQTAINGLAALGDIYPDDIIPKLAKQFSNSTLREEIRLKLGEALLQVAARCGEVLPKYGNHFVHNFLTSAKDPQPDMRASSLSLLASFCEIMRFALHPYIQEILLAVNSIIASDSEPIVRRGGIFVFKQLLVSMGADIFTLIPEEMKNIYHRLKITETYDKDDLCKYHARAVLADLDDLMRPVELP
eukprot:Phypoly_transcript_01948.p1 GENE.Phypoly_transcript_01948~~Phypoly_transcript_01948.p1  ORF type:complete len:950 (+),score=91.12 Phypoly_transcript_01948:150-2852(+)